ncbi:MAG: rod shape-determining protein MreD [Vicinamibacterales bacterium]
MKAVAAIAAVCLALALQTTLGRFTVDGTVAVDLVLVVVTYIALAWGPMAGILAGSLAGLLQDTLSSGVIGIGGLSKSLVGYLAGVVAQQFILTAPLPRLVIFMGATALHAAVFMGLYVLLGLRTFPSPYASVLVQAMGNGLLGLVVFLIVERLPLVLERRHTRRRASR